MRIPTVGIWAVFANTVDENKSRYTNDDCSNAKLARQIQNIIGRPNEQDFIKILSTNLIPNCPITKQNIAAARDIFGPDIGSLKGKTTRASPFNNMSLPYPLQF